LHDKRSIALRTATSVSVGNMTKVSFWNDAWAQGLRPKDIAPLIFNVSRRKNGSLSEALLNHSWIRDLNLFSAEVAEQHIVQYCRLWSILQRISLQPGICDSISWKLLADRHYSVKSAYLAQFLSSELTNMNWIIWKAWAPPKCKFFSWFAIQNGPTTLPVHFVGKLWSQDCISSLSVI
jgi:hypothetical protein